MQDPFSVFLGHPLLSCYQTSGLTKLVVLILVISAAVVGALALGDEFTLTKLAARETTFRRFQNNDPDS